MSRGTVDRALHGRGGIKPETRERILKVAQEMNYRPNGTARSLAMGRTMSIGVIVFDLYNNFFSQILNSITTTARERGYFVYITLTEKSPEQEFECLEHLLDGRVDGIIICPINKSGKFVQRLKETNLPVATIMNRWEEEHFTHFGIDDRRAMFEATRYAISKGYDHIIYFSPPLAYNEHSNIYVQNQRYMGFMDVMQGLGSNIKKTVIKNRDFDKVSKTIDMNQDKKNIIICSSDIFAMEVLSHLKMKGIRVPYQTGVMGFDGVDITRFLELKLTTTSINIKKMGEAAVNELINQIESGKPSQGFNQINYEITEGQTVI